MQYEGRSVKLPNHEPLCISCPSTTLARICLAGHIGRCTPCLTRHGPLCGENVEHLEAGVGSWRQSSLKLTAATLSPHPPLPSEVANPNLLVSTPSRSTCQLGFVHRIP